MSKLERITVTMPEEMAARLRAAVDSGAYATTSEIVREAMRDWMADQERKQAGIEDLRRLVEEARDSAVLDGPQAMRELRAKYAAMVEKHGEL